jgi:drug/metabolite transporter (DMT)-like permease
MRRVLPLGLLLLANGIWGSSYVVVKMALEEIPPPLLAGLRYTLASLVLWAIVAARLRGTKLPTRHDSLRLLVLGAVGVAVHGWLVFWGISLTTATDASLMIVGEVLFTTLLAIAIAREALGLPRGLGMAIGLLGVVILIAGASGEPLATAPARAVGDLLILAGLGFEACFTVLGTRLTQRYDPLVVLTLSLSGSCAVWVPVIAWFVAAGNLAPPSVAAIGGVVYLALLNSVVCYLIWFGVLKTAGATLGALSLLAQPVVGSLLGIFALGDPVLPSTLVGGACVLVCLVLAPLTNPDSYPRGSSALRHVGIGRRSPTGSTTPGSS